MCRLVVQSLGWGTILSFSNFPLGTSNLRI